MRKRILVSIVATVVALSFVAVFQVFASGQTETKSAAQSSQPTQLTKMVWISPRGTLEVMDDFNLWVPIQMGYFKQMGLQVDVEPGPSNALATTTFVSQKQADVGYPSPGVLTASIDQGMDVIAVYEMMMTQVFDFAVPENSPITSVKQLAGKTIAVGDAGWKVIIDPILAEVGVDPNSVHYVSAGADWGQAVALGKADAALTWEGLRAQWRAQGLKLRYFIGQNFSKMPANVYCARKSDLQNPAKKALLEKFLRGVSMGIYFARVNPRAAAQIVYSRFPAVREQMKPSLALESMHQLEWGYTGGARLGQGYGWFDKAGWTTYLDIIYKLGQTKHHLAVDDVVTNSLIPAANNFDKAQVEKDAKNFQLNSTWQAVKVTGQW